MSSAQRARQSVRHRDGRYAGTHRDEGGLPLEEVALVTDLEVSSGRHAPAVAVGADGTRWERADVYGRTEGAAVPYGLRLKANRPLSPSQAQRLAQLAGYAYRSTVAGEPLGEPEQDTPPRSS